MGWDGLGKAVGKDDEINAYATSAMFSRGAYFTYVEQMVDMKDRADPAIPVAVPISR